MSTPHQRAQRLANLSPEKRAQLEKWVQQRKNALPAQTIPRREESGPVPLSLLQEWFWYHPFSEPLAALIEGALQIPVLERSLNELVRRQAALRTTYHQDERGRPVQVVAPELHVSLSVESLEDRSEEEALEEGMRLFNEDFLHIELDLARHPVFYSRLLRVSPEKHLILIITPGLITDGRSESLLFRELMEFCESFSMGRPSSLPELPIQYADFAAWQHKHFQGAFLEQYLAYWCPRLADGVHMELPTDYPHSFQGIHEEMPLSSIPQEQVEQLRAVGRAEEATLFMVLLAAYQILLLHFTGQRDSLVGIEQSSREFPETDNLIGMFTHMLPLRMLIDSDLPLREYLRRVRTEALDFYAHRGMHISKLLDYCYPEHNLLPERYFTATIAYLPQNMLRMEQRSPLFVVHPQAIDREEDVDELNLQIFDTWRGLQLSFLYHTGLFKESTIAWLTGAYHKLLEAIVTDPNQRISELVQHLTRERRGK